MHYKDGKLDGKVVLYWENKKIKREVNFEKGIRRGIDKILDDLSFYL